MSSSNDEVLSGLATRLSDALKQAEIEYEASKDRFETVRHYLQDPELERPDGWQALHEATLVHRVAFQKFIHALTAFNRFILDGELPDETGDKEG